jgi:hypothetical protein
MIEILQLQMKEKTCDSQKIKLDTRKLGRYLPDNKSTLCKAFQRRKFTGSGLTSDFAQKWLMERGCQEDTDSGVEDGKRNTVCTQ